MQFGRGLFASLSFIALATSACSHKDRGASAAGPAPDQLLGDWKSSCDVGKTAALTLSSKLGVTQSTALRLDANHATETQYISSGPCDSKDIAVTSDQDLARTGSMLDGSDSALILKVGSVRVQPLSEFGARILKISKWCGHEDWAIGSSIDVTERLGGDKCFTRAEVHTSYSLVSGQLSLKTNSATAKSVAQSFTRL